MSKKPDVTSHEMKLWQGRAKRLKQRIYRVMWRCPAETRRYLTRDINLTIDQWAEKERKRG